jgi:hypothetical protein
MIDINTSHRRTIKGKVELYGSTLLNIFSADDNLQEISIARTGEKGKFFGFGVCQKATVKVIDKQGKQGKLSYIKNETLKTYFDLNNANNYARVCPTFFIKDATRDEKTNVITLTAYDALDAATAHTVSELGLEAPYTILNVADKIATALGLSGIDITAASGFETSYESGANFAGDETLRAVLNAIAEVTQTIYYVNNEDFLVFKTLGTTEGSYEINKNNYFELNTALPVSVTKIVHTTELGDNVEVGNDEGVTQYVRENPFWNARTDLDVLLPEALERIAGLTIVPYTIKWRGNYYTELGDKLSLEAKDGRFITTYLLDDSFTYNGGFSQTSGWEYNPDSERTAATNPVTIGDKINQTFAKVDKVNQTITLQASNIEETRELVSSLQVDTGSISASVSSLQTQLDDSKESINEELASLKSQVDTKVTANDVTIEIQKELANGVSSITTNTGFTFNDAGLTVSKSDSDLSTQITENGMAILNSGNEVLTVRNYGVDAANLHAVTYLLIGENSRFEDYVKDSKPRTACFFVGGSN